MNKIKYFLNGEYVLSKSDKFTNIYNPSSGEIDGLVPNCTKEEVEEAITIAHNAYQSWKNVPIVKRTQVLYNVRQLLIDNLEELSNLVALEHGKVYEEAKGDVLKAIEGCELACSAPSLNMGESLMDTSAGIDTVSFREPLGVFAGIVPYNFPAMIPMGWMAPVAIVTGNTIVLKVSSQTPRTALKIAELYTKAGLPNGVLNIVTCSRNEAEIFLEHPYVKGITFVGTTNVGKHIYKIAASNGKRVQALCEAKNHSLVLNDAALKRSVAGIINAAMGCGGQRCMALPVVVVQEDIADDFVKEVIKQASSLKIGPALDKTSQLGPVVTKAHYDNICKWIETGVNEGASLVLDGRSYQNDTNPNGFYLAPTIFDHVTNEMTIGMQEIFGPVLSIKRVKTFEEGVALINENPFANGAVIYTQSGYYGREFAKNIDAGMVGINVGIPVPLGIFPFAGHKDSFFGDLHALGKDSYRFFTETRCITTKWFDEEEKKQTKVSTWDGTI